LKTDPTKRTIEPAMFYISADITIRSPLDLGDTAAVIARALGIPSFTRDKTGRWEEQEILVSHCFGLRFAFGRPPGSREGEFGLSIDSSADAEYDGTEREVDATQYVLLLLKRASQIEASPG
jgi:hypothetical protein